MTRPHLSRASRETTGDELDSTYIILQEPSLRFFTHAGRSQDFSKGGGGGHTVSNIIVMAFSARNIVGCLPKKRLTKGGGARAPQDPPAATPLARRHPCAEGNHGMC